MTRPLVSACIIAKDEAQHIERCLLSLTGLADELIVIDTGSSDATPDIAVHCGATVFHEPWRHDFSFHRNQAMDRATGHWLLIIDADEEVIGPADRSTTRQHLEHSTLPNVLMVEHRSPYPNGEMFVDYLSRFVRASSGIRYMHPIHEQLAVREEDACLSDVVMLHHGYTATSELARKEARNLSLALQMPDDEPHAAYCRMRSFVALGKNLEAHREATRLVGMTVPAPIRADGHIFAATAILNDEAALGGRDEAERHLAEASRLDPSSPDVQLLRMVIAGRNYLRSLKRPDGFVPGEWVRFGHLWNQTSAVKAFLETMGSRRPDV